MQRLEMFTILVPWWEVAGDWGDVVIVGMVMVWEEEEECIKMRRGRRVLRERGRKRRKEGELRRGGIRRRGRKTRRKRMRKSKYGLVSGNYDCWGKKKGRSVKIKEDMK